MMSMGAGERRAGRASPAPQLEQLFEQTGAGGRAVAGAPVAAPAPEPQDPAGPAAAVRHTSGAHPRRPCRSKPERRVFSRLQPCVL
jgi:hypothetical protein